MVILWSKYASAPTKANDNIWAFVIGCQNIPSLHNRQPSSYKLTNQKTKQIISTGLIDKTNGFRIILVDKSQSSIVDLGDNLGLEVLDKEGKLYAYSEIEIDISEIEKANLAPKQIPEMTQRTVLILLIQKLEFPLN